MVCKTNKKRLDTLKKRKRVIHNLFKKDKKTGQILLFFTDELLYEKPGEKLRKNLEYFVIAQIESIDKNYSDIYLREIIFGPPRESFAPGATLATTNPITKRSESTRLMHITYNKDLDMFNVTTGVADNTYNSFGQFNHSKKFVIDVWENEDARSLTNVFVGRERHINTTSDKLPKDILETVTENSFDEIYKQVWDNNHKKNDKELLINNFVGSWFGELGLLFSNPNSQNNKQFFQFITVEKPLYVNKNKTIAVGRCIQTTSDKEAQKVLDAGADGHTAKNSFNHSILSYSMRWIEYANVFSVKFVDMDDTSIWTFTYNENEFMGDVLETPNNNPESTGPSLGKENAVIGGVELTKITELQFKPPTYNEAYAELKEKEILLEKSLNVTPESIIFEGKYEGTPKYLSLNRKTKEFVYSKDEKNKGYIEVKQRDEDKSFFEMKFSGENFTINPDKGKLEDLPNSLPDIKLGMLYKEGNLIKAKDVGTDKDNGIQTYYNFILDENRVVKSFVIIYQESGTHEPNTDHEQWPIISETVFKRIE